MKKSLLLGLGAVAMAFAAGAGIAINNSFATKTPVETKAAYANIFVHHGNDPTWNDAQFTFVGGDAETGWNYTVDVTLYKGEQFLIHDVEHDNIWHKYCDSSAFSQVLEESGSNLVCRLAGTYKIDYWYKGPSEKHISGFELKNYKSVYLYAKNSDWKTSGHVYLHTWGASGDYSDEYSPCEIRRVSEITIEGGTYGFYWAKVPSDATGYNLKAYKDDTSYKIVRSDFNKGIRLTANNAAVEDPEITVVGDIWANMGPATYLENSYARSICATSYSNAQSIVTKYNNLADKTVINGVTIQTYDVEKGGTKNVAISSIIDSLNSIPNPETAAFDVRAMSENNLTLSFTILVGSVGLFATLGLVIMHRRKREN